MNIKAARFIDYWLGNPICLFLSLLKTLTGCFIASNDKITNHKIIFLEFSELGSAILAYSAIQEAKKTYPDAKLYFWTFKKNRDAIELLAIIPKENIITIRDEKLHLFFIDTFNTLKQIHKEKIDTIIDMELFSRFSSILSFLSKAKNRVGFHLFSGEGLYRGNLHTHNILYNPYLHISKNFLAQIISLRHNPKDTPLVKQSLSSYKTDVPKIKSDIESKSNIWQKLQQSNNQINDSHKIVILNPTLNDILPWRRWPIESYIELAKKLLEHENIFIVLTGLITETYAGEKICLETKSTRIVNLIGKTNIKELNDLYNIADVLVSQDSGSTNLASLTDIHIMVLFGPETPMLYSPLSCNKTIFYADFACSPCISAYNHRNSSCKNNKCMQAIKPKEIYECVLSTIRGESSFRFK